MAVLYHMSPALSAEGGFVSGARAEFFLAGTSTATEIFDDDDLNLSRGVILTADSIGRFPPVYLQSLDYRVVVKKPSGETLYEVDPVHGRPIDKVESAEGVRLIVSDDGGPGGTPALDVSDLDASASFRNCCRAYAFVNADGSFESNSDIFNVYEVTHSGDGRYIIDLGADVAEPATIYNKAVPLVTAFGPVSVNNSPKMLSACVVSMTSSRVTIQIADETGTRTDSDFSFALFGRRPEPAA